MEHCFLKGPAEFGKYASVGLLLAALAVYAGCGRSRTYTDSEGQTTTVTRNGNSADVTFKGKDGLEAHVGENVALPDDFPKDVAIYPKATVSMSSKGKDSAMTLLLKTADPAQNVTAFYKEKLKASGWAIENEMNIEGGAVLQCSKDDRKLVVSVSKDSEHTMLSLTLEGKQ